MCSNIEWNSSLSISSSNPNSNSKNSLIYKIISPVCCFSKIFLKLCYLAKFSHHSKLTKRWAQLNPDLRVNRLGPDPLTIFPRKEKSEKNGKRVETAKTRRNRKPQQPSLLFYILTPKTFVSIQFSLILNYYFS